MDKNYYVYPTSTLCFLLELYNNDYRYFFDFAAIHQHFGLIMTLMVFKVAKLSLSLAEFSQKSPGLSVKFKQS